MRSLRQFFRVFVFAALLSGVVVTVNSCKDKGGDDDPIPDGKGTVSGVVTDDAAAPNLLAGVTVTLSDGGGTATTGANGAYTITDVTIGSFTVTFEKAGYETATTELTASSFNSEKVATADAQMKDTSYQIVGTVLDGNNDNAPIEGMDVSVGENFTATTDADGEYAIEGLTLDNFTVEFSKEGYTTKTKIVSKSDFVNKIATVDMTFGGDALLPPAKTAKDLKTGVQIWRYNDYRGCDADYAPFGWAHGNLWALEVQGLPITSDLYSGIRIASDVLNPENNPDPSTEVFESYMYGRKLITEDNKILTVSVMSTVPDAAALDMVEWGVRVVSIESPDPQSVLLTAIGASTANIQTSSKEPVAYSFDLSDFVDQEVIVAIGMYRVDPGNYLRNLLIKRIAFATEPAPAAEWMTDGTVISDLPNWRMTKEMVNSTMKQDKTSFSGITNAGSNRYEQFRAWTTNAHVGWEWGQMPLQRAEYAPYLEVFATQGYIMKTRWLGPVNLTDPEVYIYAKFDVTHDKFLIYARTFQSNQDGMGGWTYFRLTAIDASDYSATHLPMLMSDSRTGNTQNNSKIEDASTAAAPCMYRFRQPEGGEGDDEIDYARLSFDTSSINGKEVVLIISIYNGQLNPNGTSGQENKLCIFSARFE